MNNAITLPTITNDQIEAVRVGTVNDETRAIATYGCLIPHDVADDLGEQAISWLRQRFALRSRLTDRGIEVFDPCECGCGERATKTVRLLREQDRGTAEALGWSEMSLASMRVSVLVAEGHEEDVAGYVNERRDESD